MEINLIKYRGASSTTFTDRDWGENARKDLKIDEIDKQDDTVSIIIPRGTTSFNPSFYLGFFFESYKKLNVEGFRKKYRITFEDKENQDGFNEYLLEDIEDGERQAKDEMLSNYGI